jgi:hypothetical protein
MFFHALQFMTALILGVYLALQVSLALRRGFMSLSATRRYERRTRPTMFWTLLISETLAGLTCISYVTGLLTVIHSVL